MISTSDFPQADFIEKVGQVANAVHDGCHTFMDIERYLGFDSEGRQGRYHRKAAIILGLIVSAQNYSRLTPLGEEYISCTSDRERLAFLAQCMTKTPVFKSALRYIADTNPSQEQLKNWFEVFYPGSIITARRRFTTFSNYLRSADLVMFDNDQFTLDKFSGAARKETLPVGTGFNMPPPAAGLGGIITAEIDATKRDRANHVHWKLVDAKARGLLDAGLSAKDNCNIDLFSDSGGEHILYEMKSLTDDNIFSQIRKAVSQLYEYRYRFAPSTSRLCVITNKELVGDNSWIGDYLENDRNIAYEWTENFEDFNVSEGSSALLERFHI